MFRSIIVGTDGSDSAARAVDRAVALGSASGAPVTIASAGPADRAQAVVDAEAGRHADSGVDIRTEVLPGEPAAALIDRAEKGGFDLMVVGNKGMTGASRFLLGSVPNKISHHIPIALLIVRTT
jgi:nucleotide-binding universal stress UspA family protein